MKRQEERWLRAHTREIVDGVRVVVDVTIDASEHLDDGEAEQTHVLLIELMRHLVQDFARLDEHVLKLADCLTDKASVADIPAMTEQIDRLFESYVMQSQRDEHVRHSGTHAPQAAGAGSGPAVELF